MHTPKGYTKTEEYNRLKRKSDKNLTRLAKLFRA
jgi:hypothetical protein